MRYTMDETNRRRSVQEAHNREHGITPQTVISEIKDSMAQHLRASGWVAADETETQSVHAFQTAEPQHIYRSEEELRRDIEALEEKMRQAAQRLAFEEAAGYRDRVRELKMLELALD